jgi:hypothetical protein
MKYEIINPSDPYTIEHSDFLALAAACVLLGNGQYGLSPIDHDGEKVPLFIFGGFDQWWSKHSPDASIDKYIEANKLVIAEAMESVSLTSGKRSSMNDIGGRAVRWAKNFRGETESAGPAAPRQVFVS